MLSAKDARDSKEVQCAIDPPAVRALLELDKQP
jgi:hypothetical protein